jgi:hypothetical protein
MGWIPKQDEETGIGFALPPPTAGPEERRRPGRSTEISTRAYTARAGDVSFSVQFVSTPDSPASLAREVPPQRMPLVAIDQVRAEGDYEAEVLSNERVDDLDPTTYDAQVEISSDDERAIWWMRTRDLGEVVLVTQVVVFMEGGNHGELEAQGATAFDRLNGTVEVPEELGR